MAVSVALLTFNFKTDKSVRLHKHP